MYFIDTANSANINTLVIIYLQLICPINELLRFSTRFAFRFRFTIHISCGCLATPTPRLTHCSQSNGGGGGGRRGLGLILPVYLL